MKSMVPADITLEFQQTGSLLIHKISDDRVLVTACDVMCFEDGIVLAQAIALTFGTDCVVSDINHESPFCRTYTFMTDPDGGNIRNIDGLAKSIRSRLITVVALMDDMEIELTV